MFPGSVLSNKSGKTYEEMYGKEVAAQLKDRLYVSHIGQKCWCKNLTKETDERVANTGKKVSVSLKKYYEEGGAVWNKDLTKETDERVAKNGEAVGLGLRNYYRNGGQCWLVGLTKEMDPRVALLCENMRKHLVDRTGKTYEEIYGEDKAVRIRQKQHNARVGKTLEEILKNVKLEDVVKKMSESAKNREDCPPQKGLTFDEYYGVERSKEIKDKLRKASEGIKPSLETRKKMSEASSGENNPNWQGGIGNFPYAFEFNEKFKSFIRERDSNTCQLCGKTKEQEGMNLCVHHICYDKENNCSDEYDFTTLCDSCNTKVNFNRGYWTKFFQRKIELRFCMVN